MPRKKMDEETKAIHEMNRTIEQVKKEETKTEKKFGRRVHVCSDRILHCKGTFIEEVLGGFPSDDQLYSTYIASKAPDAKTMREEIEIYGKEDVERQQTTIFPKDKNGNLCIIEYQFKGFLKSAAKALKRSELLTIPAHEKVIHELIRVSAKPDDRIDRWIPLHAPGQDKPQPYLIQRPLRIEDQHSARTALASSEALPPGTWFEFYIHLLNYKIADTVLSWMEYGKLNGLLQWRNAGMGRFTVEIEQEGKWSPLEQV